MCELGAQSAPCRQERIAWGLGLGFRVYARLCVQLRVVLGPACEIRPEALQRPQSELPPTVLDARQDPKFRVYF